MRSQLAGLGCALLLWLSACSNDATEPHTVSGAPDGSPMLDVSDGAHAGNPHFFFLPPIVPNPTYAGATDPGQAPAVTVCEWSGGGCRGLIAYFSTQGGTAAQAVRYDVSGQQYIVNWQTDQCWQPSGTTASCTLDATKTYRLRVLVGAVEMGHADLRIFASNQDAKNLQTGDLIPLVNGRTLPVKFRIEQGAVIPLVPGTPAAIGTVGGTVTGNVAGESIGLTIPAGAVAGTTQITVQAAGNPVGVAAWSPVVDLGPTGTTFAQPVRLTLGFDPAAVPPGVPASALRLYTFDGSGWVEVPGGSVDSIGNTVSAPIAHFSYYTVAVAPNTITGVPTATTISVGQSTTLTGYLVEYQAATDIRCLEFQTPYGPQPVCQTYPTPQVVPVANQAVSWISTDPHVVSVPLALTYTDVHGTTESPPITGVAAGTATVVANASVGSAGVPITVQSQAQMSVSPLPQNFVMRVPAGQTLTSRVQITSANGIALQHVVVSPVSDYYTGGVYDWITLSLDSTSGTAITLTVTASPPADQAVQNYGVRFDIAAANAPSVNYWLWPLTVTSGEWRAFPSLPGGRYGFTAVSVPNGIYVMGGNVGTTGQALTNQAGTSDNLFLSTSSWIPRASMPVAKWYTNGGAYLNGKIYLFGGAGDPYGSVDTWVYDTDRDQWQPGASPPVFGTSCGFAGTIGHSIYVGQAYYGGNQLLFFRYDPDAAPGGVWTQLPNSLSNHCFGASGVIDGKLYVTGGEGQPQEVTEVYDPGTGKWARLADLPVPVNHAAGIAANGKLYVIGGGSSAAGTASGVWGNVEVYDPATDTWDTQSVPALRTARQLFGGVFYAGNLEVFGGDLDGTGNPTASAEYFLPR